MPTIDGGGVEKNFFLITNYLSTKFKDISVINSKNGKPSFLITDKLKKIVKKQFKTSSFNFFLSISDEKKYSLAYVILQKK